MRRNTELYFLLSTHREWDGFFCRFLPDNFKYRDTVRRYWSADTLFWQLSIDHNVDVQAVSSWAPKVVKKCESKHWFSCGEDGRTVGRSVGVRSGDYQIFGDGSIAETSEFYLQLSAFNLPPSHF